MYVPCKVSWASRYVTIQVVAVTSDAEPSGRETLRKP